MCSIYSSRGSAPIKCDELQSAGKPKEDKVENEVSNNDESDEDQSQGKGLMPESRTAINQVCVRLDEKKPVTPSKRQLDRNGNLIPLPPATPPPEASNPQDLPSVLEKKVIVFAAPDSASSSDVTVSPVAFQSELIPIDNDSHSTNESPRRPYRISKAWKAAEAANRSIGVETSPQDAPITEGTVDSSGEYRTRDSSGENRQSKEDLESVEHADLGLKNTTEAANGSIGVESSPQDGPISEGEINSSGEYRTPDNSSENRQSEEDLECVEHADLGLKNSSEKPDGREENEVPEMGKIVKSDIVYGDGGFEGPNVDEGNIEARDPSKDSIDKKEKPSDKVGTDAETQSLDEDPMAKKQPHDIAPDNVPGTECAEGFHVENGNIDARQPSEDSTDEEEEPADGVESDFPVSDGIAEELDETIGTGVLDVEDDDLDVEDEETEPQHPVKVDIDEASPMRSFFSRGLALYMEARGFVEPGDEAMGGEGLENDQGQNAVEPLMRKGESFIEWGLALLLEAMDGSIGI